MLEIRETKLLSKQGEPDGGEDRIFVSGDFWAVIDGATAKSDRTYGGMTGGELVANAIATALSDLDRDSRAIEAVSAFDSAVEAALVASGTDMDSLPVDRPCAAVCVYSLARQEVWRVGDCHFRIDGESYLGTKRVDEIAGQMRAAILRAHMFEGASWDSLAGEDPGRAAIMPLLIRQSRFMNNTDAGEFAFGAVDGSGRSSSFLEVVAADGASELVLSSDGYCTIEGTLAQAEDALANLLQRDPGLFLSGMQTKGVTPGNVSFDDRAFLRATV